MSVLKTEHEKNLYALKREREMKLLHAWNKIYQTLEFYIFKSRLTSQDSILLQKSLPLLRSFEKQPPCQQADIPPLHRGDKA